MKKEFMLWRTKKCHKCPAVVQLLNQIAFDGYNFEWQDTYIDEDLIKAVQNQVAMAPTLTEVIDGKHRKIEISYNKEQMIENMGVVKEEDNHD